jgi:adenosylcobinamide-GDP ribazoletransferase
VLRPLLIGLSFLTIIPVRFRTELTERQMLGAAVLFPVVGLLLGILAAISETLFGYLFGPGLSIALMLLAMELATGGLHLDGLSDTFDALSSKADRERRLEIMRQGASGPAGNAAVFFTLGLKYLALMSVGNLTNFLFLATVLFMPAIGRWAMLVGMLVGRRARGDGLGASFIGRLGSGRFALATLVLASLMVGPAFMSRLSAPIGWWVFVIITLLVVFAYVLVVRHVSNRRFGGFTGDVLGAIGETTEVLFPLLVIAWSRLYTL